MRIKRALLALTALALCVALSGCRFAAEERTAREDKFVGVSLRLEDWGAPVGEDEHGPYYEREPEDGAPTELSAEQAEALLRGEPIEIAPQSYGIGDRFFYVHTWADEQGNESTGVDQQNWPGEIKTHVTVTDTETKYESDAEAYVTGANFRYGAERMVVIEVDNLYVRPDGSVYAQREGGGVSGHVDGFSREINVTSSATGPDGATKGETTRAKVTVRYVNELVGAAVLAFDENGALLGRAEIDWQGAREPICVPTPKGAAYLVLEQTGIDIEGATVVERALANLPLEEDESAFTLRVPDGSGFAYPVDLLARPAA